MKLIEQLLTYKQQKQQSSENEKVINKLKEKCQNESDQKKAEIGKYNPPALDTFYQTPSTLINKKEQLNPIIEDINDQTMLIDTKQIEDAEKTCALDEKDITRPINNYADYVEINKLKANVIKAKQNYLNLTKKFIKDINIMKE